MEKLRSREIDALERVGYLPALRRLVKSHTCPVWYLNDAGSKEEILANGTMVFVSNGNRTFAITANHVFEGYVGAKAENSFVQCQVGNVRVELELYLSFQDKEFDIVGFTIPEIIVAATGAVVHTLPATSPVEEKDLVIMGGYPGNRRKERHDEVDFDFVTFIGRAEQPSDRHFAISLNLKESYWPQGIKIPVGSDLGGMSGGPVFRLSNCGLETLELVGIIYEAHQSFELVFSTPLVSPIGVSFLND